MKIKLSRILPLIGIALFVYVVKKAGISNLISTFLGANYFYIAIAVLFLPLIVLLQTFKWRYVVGKQGIKMGLAEAYKIQLVSIFYGFVTPARIGSFVKIAYLQEKTKNLGKSASSVVIDRALDLLTVLLLAGFGSLMVINKFSRILLYIAALTGLFILLIAVFLIESKKRFVLEFIYRKMLSGKMKAKVKKSFSQFYKSIPKYRFFIVPFAASIATWLIIYLQIFFIAVALNINVPYFVLAVMLAISTLVSLLPISIAGIGPREASLITLLGFFGIEPARIVAMSLLGIFTTNTIISLAGFWFSLKGTKPKQIKNKTTAKKQSKSR